MTDEQVEQLSQQYHDQVEKYRKAYMAISPTLPTSDMPHRDRERWWRFCSMAATFQAADYMLRNIE